MSMYSKVNGKVLLTKTNYDHIQYLLELSKTQDLEDFEQAQLALITVSNTKNAFNQVEFGLKSSLDDSELVQISFHTEMTLRLKEALIKQLQNIARGFVIYTVDDSMWASKDLENTYAKNLKYAIKHIKSVNDSGHNCKMEMAGRYALIHHEGCGFAGIPEEHFWAYVGPIGEKSC